MMGSTAFRLIAGAFLFAAASPASAAYIFNGTEVAMFDFTKGYNKPGINNVSDGNARIYSATSPDFGTVHVRVTGWSLEKVKTGKDKYGNPTYTSYVRDSKLEVWNGGLGITSGDDDGGANNQHTSDNEERKDFFLLQFNAPVAFIGAGFNTYSVLGKTKDSDATIKYGYNYSTPWNCTTGSCGDLNLDGKTEGYLNSLFDGTFESLGNGTSGHRLFSPDIYWGNTWLLGSSFVNKDGKIDGFKLSNLAVVPEPATWLMMISGFGLLGGALRRQRRIALATA
jgi:hypothetical protein